MKDNSTYMGIQGDMLDELHEAFNGEEISYVARRGFAVNVGDRPQPHVQFPFITISEKRQAFRVRDTMKDFFRGVQLHLNAQDSHYSEVEITKPKDLVDAVIRFAKEAELASYANLVHTGPMPVYAVCMTDEQSAPIITELEQRMTAIKAEDEKLAQEPIDA